MNKTKIYPKDVVILFADLQEGIAELSKTIPSNRLKKGVTGLAKIAKILDLPVIITAVADAEGSAKIMPEIAQVLGNLPVIYRTTADSMLNEEIVGAIKASGRQTILISGVATELAVQLPALSGVDMGYRTFVVVDACGGMSERTENAALSRIERNGGNLVSVLTLAGELAGDFRTEVAQALTPIIFEMATA
ncbi:MAG: isochorismatase family protein [Brasilonema angustatum HA4187-MV1]|jgi:nicotinamidase-related amidase|nr:isochorismatase family protein [Brasilonema angustatum HA4187-MV1]